MSDMKHLEGMQAVETGAVHLDDLIIYKDGSRLNARDFPGPTPCVENFNAFGHRVYRKIPVAKQGDSDPSWKKVRDDAKQAFVDGMVSSNGEKAKTNDDGKPPLAMLPWAGIREVAQVQAFGHFKYKDFHNFRKGMEISRNLSCAIRHISEYMDGQDNDRESGCNHLAHAACRLLFALQNIQDGTVIDDRFKKEPNATPTNKV